MTDREKEALLKDEANWELVSEKGIVRTKMLTYKNVEIFRVEILVADEWKKHEYYFLNFFGERIQLVGKAQILNLMLREDERERRRMEENHG